MFLIIYQEKQNMKRKKHMNINTSLSELNAYNASVTNLVSNIYKYTDDYDTFTGTVDKTVSSIAKQANGKILVGSTGDSGDSGLIRLNADGSIDGTFSPTISGSVFSIAVQSNGKIYVGGEFTHLGSSNNIVKLNSDGTTDTGFIGGVGFGSTVKKLKLSSDESYLIASGEFSSYDGQPANYIAKISTTTGELSATFQDNIAAFISSSVHTFDLDDNDDIVLVCDSILKKIDSDGNLISTIVTSFNGDVTQLKIKNNNVFCSGEFETVTVDEIVKNIKFFAKFNMISFLDETFDLNLDARDSGTINDFDFDASNNIYIGGNIFSIDGNNAHFFGKVSSSGEFVKFNDPFDFEEYIHAVLVSSDGSVFVGGEFNKPNYRIAKFNQDGSLVTGFFLGHQGDWFGIRDGGDDLEDGGNFINTNLTQSYDNAVGDSVTHDESIPNTHVPAQDDRAYDAFNVYEYEYMVTNPNGKVSVADDYFGAGSKYFTNMYTGMFCLVANNININEFSVTGDSGTDGGGEVRATSFEISIKGETYSCFVKSIWGDDPSMNQLIIVDGKLDGLTQLYDTSSEYDDHAIQGLAGRSMIAYLLLCKGGDASTNYDEDGDPLDYIAAEEIATVFVNIINGYGIFNSYTFNFNPANKSAEGDEGSLDTSIVAGKSIQRSGYMETVNSENERKVSIGMDGETITDKVQTIGDILGIVEVPD